MPVQVADYDIAAPLPASDDGWQAIADVTHVGAACAKLQCLFKSCALAAQRDAKAIGKAVDVQIQIIGAASPAVQRCRCTSFVSLHPVLLIFFIGRADHFSPRTVGTDWCWYSSIP